MGGRLHALEGLSDMIRVLDICTGTGCILLELYSRLRTMRARDAGERQKQPAPPRPMRVEAHGLDISPLAVRLARANADLNFPAPGGGGGGGDGPPPARPTFARVDIFRGPDAVARAMLPPASNCRENTDSSGSGIHYDVVTCNPPYVSEAAFRCGTARSVRNFEPKLANVPPPPPVLPADGTPPWPQDRFYARVLSAATALARARAVLLEVGDLAQAERVAATALRMLGHRHWRRGCGAHLVGEVIAAVDVEIWRDWPDSPPEPGEVTRVVVEGTQVPVKGSGHGRAVLVQFRYATEDRDSSRWNT